MRKITRVALGAALLMSTAGAAVDLAFAAPADDQFAVVYQRARIDEDMSALPGVFVTANPSEAVLGVQVRRSAIADSMQNDMLRVIAERADMDRGQAEAPH